MNIEALNAKLANSTAQKVLQYFLGTYKGEIALSSSLSYEDQVLTDMICEIDKSTRIFTLDTGRCFPETYSLIERTNKYYAIKIEVYFPDYHKVQDMVNTYGVNLFYNSVELRHLCCKVRKIEPLQRAMRGLKVWICGLRSQQSVTRENMQLVEWDEQHNLIKVNPLIHWTEDDVKRYVFDHSVPYNKLHEKGFPSIGCQPCTRSIQPEENIRAGRWWWESSDHRECGLHQR